MKSQNGWDEETWWEQISELLVNLGPHILLWIQSMRLVMFMKWLDIMQKCGIIYRLWIYMPSCFIKKIKQYVYKTCIVNNKFFQSFRAIGMKSSEFWHFSPKNANFVIFLYSRIAPLGTLRKKKTKRLTLFYWQMTNF